MHYTILICTHNRCTVLPRALRAINQLKIPPGKHMELVVVDSASTDQTAAVVEEFAQRAPFPVRYVREDRLGHSIALNTGIQAAQGEIIAFTDDDGCPVPDWLLHLDSAFEKKQADWVFGRVEPIWDGGQTPRWFGPQVLPMFALLDYGPQAFVVRDSDQMFIGVNNACRRASLDRVGGYRPDLGPMGGGIVGAIGADEDLFHRALAAGCTIVYEPAAMVQHIISASRSTKRYHLRQLWRGASHRYRAIRTSSFSGSRFLGLPRYYYRLCIDHCLLAVKHAVARDRSNAFYHQLQFMRFLSLIWQGFRHSFYRESYSH